MAENEYKEYYDFIIEVVHAAGQMVIEDSKGPINVTLKEATWFNPVTETDRKVEEFITSKIQEKYPDHKIIGEESTPHGTNPNLTDDHTWIIDPVDGTSNFINKIPLVAISVALAIKKEVVVGIVFNPIINKFYSAIKGGGAYCNGEKITSSKNEDLHKALIGHELSMAIVPFLRERTLERVKKLSEFGVSGFRSFGCAAVSLCYVADGTLGVYFTDGLQCWDVAAGVLILQEAGGCASHPDGGKFDMFSRVILTAGNKALTENMVEILSECDEKTKEIMLNLMPENIKAQLSS